MYHQTNVLHRYDDDDDGDDDDGDDGSDMVTTLLMGDC